MSAGVSDKITDTRNAARPNSAKATGTRSAGGTSLACDSLTGWPTASKVHFVTYQADSDSVPIAGTQLDCYGIVSGSTIGSISVIDGTDTGNSVNDVVEMLPTAAWGQDLADALTTEHSRTGTHTAITATSLTTSGAITATGNVQSSAALVADTVSEKTSAAGVTVDGVKLKDSTIQTAGAISPVYTANPYKFSVYRNAAWNTSTGSQFNKVIFDTKTFDTGTNFDVVTNNRFVAPIAGFYQFEATIGTTTTNVWLVAALFKNGVQSKTGQGNYNAAGAINSYNTVSGLIQLAATDYVEVHIYSGTASQGGLTGASQTYFDGFLLSAT